MPCRVSNFRSILYAVNSSCHADYAIANKLTPFISMQNHYNLVYREEEREMLPTLKVSPYPFQTNKHSLGADVRCWLHPVVAPCSWSPDAPCHQHRYHSRRL